MKRFLLLISVLLFSTNLFAQVKWFNGSLDETIKSAGNENKLVLLNLSSDKIQSCILLDNQFSTNPEYYRFINENFISKKIDYSANDAESVFQYYNVTMAPTILILDSDGFELDRIVGYTPPPKDFINKLNNSFKGVDRLSDLVQAYNDNPGNVAIIFRLAYKYRNLFDNEMANKYFEEVVNLDEAAKEIKMPYGQEGDLISIYEYALFLLGDMERFIIQAPDSKLADEAFKSLASVHIYAQDPDKAQIFFKRLRETYPDDPQMLKYFIQYSAINATSVEEGLEIAEIIYTDENNRNPEFIRCYAKLLAMAGRRREIINIYGSSFINNFPDDPASLFAYAEFWMDRKQNVTDAIQKAERAFELDPVNYRIPLARIFIDNGDQNAAVSIYGPGYINQYMDDPATLYPYAHFWGEIGQNLDSALRAAQRFIELNPTPYGYDTLSLIFWRQQKYEEAISAEEKAIALSETPLPRYQARIDQLRKELKGKKK